jgi:hypothetical protein
LCTTRTGRRYISSELRRYILIELLTLAGTTYLSVLLALAGTALSGTAVDVATHHLPEEKNTFNRMCV